MEQEQTGFIQGKRVILRPLRKKTDYERCLRWVNDSEVWKYLSIKFPITDAEEEAWFDSHKDHTSNIVFAIETLDGKHIGNIGIHQIDWISRTCITGTVIGEKEYWGKGYGTDAKMALLSYAFTELNLRKVKSLVVGFNKRSLNYSLKCGYTIEGRLRREFFRNGRYYDMIQLAIFKPNWLPVWKQYQES